MVGNAGTVNTGAFDDLERLADLCASEGLWFHVDGAFGALAAISPRLKPLTRGMERADSVAFDLHKWMYVPIEVGCVLVRDAESHRNTFVASTDYLAHAERGVSSGSVWMSEYGMQLSRGFRALKVWMSLKAHGLETYSRLIDQNVDQARFLERLVHAHPDLELMAEVPLNIVCFRFVAKDLDDASLDTLNETILFELHEQGIAVPTSTRIGGRFVFRVAIVNHRSRREDFEALVSEVVARGQSLARSVAAARA